MIIDDLRSKVNVITNKYKETPQEIFNDVNLYEIVKEIISLKNHELLNQQDRTKHTYKDFIATFVSAGIPSIVQVVSKWEEVEQELNEKNLQNFINTLKKENKDFNSEIFINSLHSQSDLILKKDLEKANGIIEKAIANIDDCYRREFYENLRHYFRIKQIDRNNTPIVNDIILEVIKLSENNDSDPLKPLIEDFNNYTLEEKYPLKYPKGNKSKKPYRDFSGGGSGESDIKLFYYDDENNLNCISGSVTKSDDREFEDKQNNTHPYRNFLSKEIYKIGTTQNDFIEKSNLRSNKNGKVTYYDKEEYYKLVLSQIDSLDYDSCKYLQDSGASVDEVYLYLLTLLIEQRKIMRVKKADEVLKETGEEIKNHETLVTLLKKKQGIFNIKHIVNKSKEDKQQYISNYLIGKKNIDDKNRHFKERLMELEEIIPENNEHISTLEQFESDNNIKHYFTTINNSIVILDDKNNIELEQTALTIMFSHIMNELDFLKFQNHDDIVPYLLDYFDSTFKIHTNTIVTPTYSNKKNKDNLFIGNEYSFKDFLKNKTKNDTLIKGFKNITNIVIDKKRNQILRNNIVAFTNSFYGYLKSIDNKELLDKIIIVLENNSALTSYVYDKIELKESKKREEEKTLINLITNICSNDIKDKYLIEDKLPGIYELSKDYDLVDILNDLMNQEPKYNLILLEQNLPILTTRYIELNEEFLNQTQENNYNKQQSQNEPSEPSKTSTKPNN